MSNEPALVFPGLAPFYERVNPLTYTLLRVAFGLTIVTHGIPKLLGTAHGSMANPMAGSTRQIGEILGMPFAPQLAVFVALLETFGGLAVAGGLATRIFAPMLAIQMVAICFAVGPTYRTFPVETYLLGHTHGNYNDQHGNIVDKAHDYHNADNFSQGDIDTYEAKGMTGAVLAPDGTIKTYDPITNTTTVVGNINSLPTPTPAP